MKADFNQYTSSAFNKSAGVDFSMHMGDVVNADSAYDANGNIKLMMQSGLKTNTSSPIDSLVYSYQTNSNELSKVIDGYNAKDSKLGDFKYDPATKQSSDYLYDVNGNLTKDNNKAISGIAYNHLNLPSVITVTGKGTITYTYDAAGNKLKKVTVDNTASPSRTTTTLYIAGAVYEMTYYNLSDMKKEESGSSIKSRVAILLQHSQVINEKLHNYFGLINLSAKI